MINYQQNVFDRFRRLKLGNIESLRETFFYRYNLSHFLSYMKIKHCPSLKTLLWNLKFLDPSLQILDLNFYRMLLMVYFIEFPSSMNPSTKIRNQKTLGPYFFPYAV